MKNMIRIFLSLFVICSSNLYSHNLRWKSVSTAPLPPFSSSFHEIIKDPPQWMLDQINDELAYYKINGVSSIEDMLDQLEQEFTPSGFPKQMDEQTCKTWAKSFLLCRYKIIQGHLYVKDYSLNAGPVRLRREFVENPLIRLLLTIPLPDGLEFVISYHDSLHCTNISAPIFSFGKSIDNPFVVTIPDCEMLNSYGAHLDPQIDAAIEKLPWENKQDFAFWRGSTTGGSYSLPCWHDLPRSQLVYLSKDSDLIDAKFTAYVQGAESNQELLADKNISGPFISPQDSLQYRYLIDIDGNACTWSRFYWILRSNCVPFKQTSSMILWYHRALEPFVHFIPYAYDLSDLPEMIQWAKSHPNECKKVAENGRKFVLRELTTEHACAYLYLLLKEYATLFEGLPFDQNHVQKNVNTLKKKPHRFIKRR